MQSERLRHSAAIMCSKNRTAAAKLVRGCSILVSYLELCIYFIYKNGDVILDFTASKVTAVDWLLYPTARLGKTVDDLITRFVLKKLLVSRSQKQTVQNDDPVLLAKYVLVANLLY
jgi:hypothetical protein